jgi:hypothetical protein
MVQTHILSDRPPLVVMWVKISMVLLLLAPTSCISNIKHVFGSNIGCRGGYIGFMLSDRSGRLPRLSLLRTVRATFTAYGSSTLKVTLLPGNTKSGGLTHGISSSVVLFPLCTEGISFTIDKYVSFDMSVRGMF